MPADPRPVCVGLCRCSTDQQDRSISEQESAIQAWAKANGATLLKLFADEGVSGLELSRPGLDACLRFLSTSKQKGTVVLWSRDRLVRPEDPIDGLVMERQIRYAGWELCYLTGSNATGHPLVDAILGLVEHHASGEYLRKLARDSLRSIVERLKAGDVPGGKIPYGYCKAVFDSRGELLQTIARTEKHRKAPSERTRLVLGAEEEVATIQWMFDRFLCGWIGPARLAAELEGRGAPPPTSNPWNQGTVRDMLRNPVYAGDVVWNRETSARCVRLLDGTLSGDLATHESAKTGRKTGWAQNDPRDHIVLRDRHPPIVDREVFTRVQAILAARGSRSAPRYRSTQRSHALGGLLLCGKCGAMMTSQTTRSKGRVYRYYGCPAKSHRYRIRADRVEQALRARLLPHVGTVELRESLLATDRDHARESFRALVERVTLHAMPGRPPRKGKRRSWRLRVIPTSFVELDLDGGSVAIQLD